MATKKPKNNSGLSDSELKKRNKLVEDGVKSGELQTFPLEEWMAKHGKKSA